MTRLVIGVGHPYRGDDAAGLEVAQRVKTAVCRQSITGTFELLDLWEPEDDVIVVDATRSEADPGTIVRIDAAAEPLPEGTFASTHAVGISETIELARALGRMPHRLEIYGIEASDVTMGAPLSGAVARAVDAVVEEIDRA